MILFILKVLFFLSIFFIAGVYMESNFDDCPYNKKKHPDALNKETAAAESEKTVIISG